MSISFLSMSRIRSSELSIGFSLHMRLWTSGNRLRKDTISLMDLRSFSCPIRLGNVKRWTCVSIIMALRSSICPALWLRHSGLTFHWPYFGHVDAGASEASRSGTDRIDNEMVARAPAQVAGNAKPDLVIGWMRVRRQKLKRRKNHPGGAIAAL